MKNPAYAIKNATIVDLADGSLHRNSTVHVADGRIQSVDQGSVTGSAARTIDAQGGYLMPGLCDAHVHVTAATFDFAALSQWSPSYSCYCCAGLGRICDGVTEVRRACRDEIRRGAHHIKLMLSGGASSPTDRIDSTQMSIEEIRVAVEETEAANIYAMAHAYTARAANRALHCGVRSIEHGNLMDDSSRELLKSKSAFLVPTMITHQVAIDFGQQMGLPTSMIEKTGQVVDAGKLGHAQSHRAGVTMVYAEALKLYQWMTPLLHLDVSTKLVQNLKLIDLLVGVGTEHMRRPRLPLVGAERAFIEKAVAQALATRPVEYQSAP